MPVYLLEPFTLIILPYKRLDYRYSNQNFPGGLVDLVDDFLGDSEIRQHLHHHDYKKDNHGHKCDCNNP